MCFALGIVIGVASARHRADEPIAMQPRRDAYPLEGRAPTAAAGAQSGASETQVESNLREGSAKSPLDASSSSSSCNPGKIIAWLRKVAAGVPGTQPLSSVDWDSLAPLVAEQAPREVFDLALRLPAGHVATKLCVEALRLLGRQDGHAAWKLLEQLSPGALDREATSAVLGAWASIDPKAASLAAMSLPDRDSTPLVEVAVQWALKDPAAAIKWAGALSPATRKTVIDEAARCAAGEAAAHGSFEGLHALVSASADPAVRSQVASVAAGELAWVDADKAFQWMATLPEAIRPAALLGAVAASSKTAPDRAATQLAQQLARLPHKTSVDTTLKDCVTLVSLEYAATDVRSAMNWASSLSPANRSDAVRSVMSSWAEQSPATASEWLARQPPGDIRNEAALAFASNVAALDPECARSWLATCPYSVARDQLLGRIEKLALEVSPR